MLQKFLNNQFINVAEDENLNKLKKASNDVVKKLSKNKSKVISYTLIALDPDIEAENAEVNEVNENIIKHWSTFAVNTKDSQLTVIRAVIIHSLHTIALTDISYACLIWLTGRNIIRYYKLGREKDLLSSFLLDLGNRIEKEAEKNWSLNTVDANINIENIATELEEITSVTLNKSTLVKMLEDASGPTTKEGATNYKSPNPNWTNEGAQWSYNFAPRAANSIAYVVNEALEEQKKQIMANQSQIQDVINQLVGNFKSIINDTQNEILQKNTLSNMRTQLLWWKESLYSPSLNKSYRELNDGLLEIIMAVDYANFVPYLYPVSADYFLKETYKRFAGKEDKATKISDLISTLEENGEQLREIFSGYIEETGRISFFNYIKGLILGMYNPDQFKFYTGVDSSTDITKSDFALWMFHDSQSQKIVVSI